MFTVELRALPEIHFTCIIITLFSKFLNKLRAGWRRCIQIAACLLNQIEKRALFEIEKGNGGVCGCQLNSGY